MARLASVVTTALPTPHPTPEEYRHAQDPDVLTGADTTGRSTTAPRTPPASGPRSCSPRSRSSPTRASTSTLASPGGRTPVVDEGSLDPGTIGEEESAKQRKALDALQERLASPGARDVDLDAYDAVFVPGGHGPMEDLAVDPDLGRVLVTMLDGGKVVSSVCHGPAGLLPAKREDGSWLFEGRRLTAFTDAEEEQAGLADKAPWLLESRLRESGASFSSGEPWAPFVVVDGNLVTGQNPASSTGGRAGGRHAAEGLTGALPSLVEEVAKRPSRDAELSWGTRCRRKGLRGCSWFPGSARKWSRGLVTRLRRSSTNGCGGTRPSRPTGNASGRRATEASVRPERASDSATNPLALTSSTNARSASTAAPLRERGTRRPAGSP